MRRPCTVLSVLLLLVLASAAGAQTGAPAFSKNYFVTGDYSVAGVALKGTGTRGFATGRIVFPAGAIPSGGEPVAAFLYWESVVSRSKLDAGLAGAQFNGHDIAGLTKVLNPLGSTPCWSSGGATGAAEGSKKMLLHRADVLRWLVRDSNGRFVPTAEQAVRLPDSGSKGNSIPFTLGATLLVVYRTPTAPLRSVVLYEGGFVLNNDNRSVTSRLEGFYQSSSSPSAKLSVIAGNGSPDFSERLLFNNQVVAVNPFATTGWDNPTFNVSALVPGNAASATVTLDNLSVPKPDCISGGAIIFSTAVQDTDGDALIDGIEDSSVDAEGRPWRTPTGRLLPDLHQMGAGSGHKDQFIEVGAMVAAAGTAYGTGVARVVDPAGHSHLPSPAVLKIVGDAFKNAPVANAVGGPGIRLHFDMGPEFDPGVAAEYVVQANLARGGEIIPETACVPTPQHGCQFPDYPGAVSWKIGFQLYRDQPVAFDGAELPPADQDACLVTRDCRTRFDAERKDFFRYVLFAHSRGIPKSDQPCLDAIGVPTGYGSNGRCGIVNPEFHVPRTSSGVADLPGGDAMVTLGGWDGFTGTEFVQASTLMHELGHTFWRAHGGNATIPVQPNCKPNYISVMSYLFQVRGLLDDNGVPHVDYSSTADRALDELRLADGAVSGSPNYRTSWYVPAGAGTAAAALGLVPAKKFCDGTSFPASLPGGWVPMARLDNAGVSTPIDWAFDGFGATVPQDVNFDGVLTPISGISAGLRGANDWASLALAQISARRNMGGYSAGIDFGGGAELDVETVVASGNTPPNQLTACVLGANCVDGTTPLHRTRLTWQPPHVGAARVVRYYAYRVPGGSLTAQNAGSKILVGMAVPAPATTVIDTEELPDGRTFTYFTIAEFTDGTFSGPSNTATITAVNEAPSAATDLAVTLQNRPVTVAAPGVLANDTDVDSPPSVLRAIVVEGPAHGSLMLNADGSFTYTPVRGYSGTDQFTYVANDGMWPGDPTIPLSADSNVGHVTIRVDPVTGSGLPVPK